MAGQEEIDELKEIIATGVQREEYGDRRTDFRTLADLRRIQLDEEVAIGTRNRPPYRKTMAKRPGTCA